MTEPAPTMDGAARAARGAGSSAADGGPGSSTRGPAGSVGGVPSPVPARPPRFGTELSASRAALVALLAGGALAFAAARAVELLVVVAVVQAVFVVTWALGAGVAVVSGESFDGPAGEVEMGPTPALLGSPDPNPANSDPDPDPADSATATAEPDISASSTADRGILASDTLADFPPDAAPREVAQITAPPAQPSTDGGLPAAAAMPGRLGAVVIGAGTAAATDYAVMHWPHSALSPMLGILGLAVPVMFAHQLIRGVVRARVVESLSGIALIIAAVVALPTLVQLRHEAGGGHLVAATTVAAGVAVALGLLVDLIWSRPRFDPDVARGLTGVVVGTVAGAAAGAYLLRNQLQFTTGQAVLYCAGIAAVSALVAVATSLIGYSSPTTGVVPSGARLLRPVALALLPVMLVTPAAYVLLVSA